MEFEIIDVTKTNNSALSRTVGLCEVSGRLRKKANICIRMKDAKSFATAMFINDETFFNAIKNAEDSVKEEIKKALGITEEEPNEYQLSDEDNALLDFDDYEALDTSYKQTKYWNKLKSLADRLEIDYTKVKDKDYIALRKLFDKEV